MTERVGLVNRFHGLLFLVIVAITLAAVIRVPDIPLPVHWGVDGTPDLMWPKAWALAIMPVTALGLVVLFWIIGKFAEPERLEPGRNVLESVLSALLVLLAAIQAGLLLLGIGSDIDMIRIVAGAVAVVFFVLGMELPRSQPNAFAGLRLPWTINDPVAWKRAHRLAGGLFFVAGIVLAAAAWLWPEPSILLPVLLGTAFVPTLGAVLGSLWARGRKA